MILGLTLVVGGCAVQPKFGDPPVAFAAEEYTPLYHAAVQTLRDAGFEIDRQDHRFGVITTRPLPAGTIFEPWRTSNVTLGQTLESTLNDQRRIARIYLEPATLEPATPGETRDPNDAAAPIDFADFPEPQFDPANIPPHSMAVMPMRDYRLRIEVTIERRQMPARRLSGSTSRGRMFNDLTETPTHLCERGIDGPYWQTVGRDQQLETRLINQTLEKVRAASEGPAAKA